jgi:hypothetical protein
MARTPRTFISVSDPKAVALYNKLACKLIQEKGEPLGPSEVFAAVVERLAAHEDVTL